jgi:hypothetical protein
MGEYREVDAALVGAPRDTLVKDDEVPKNAIALGRHELVDALGVGDRHR